MYTAIIALPTAAIAAVGMFFNIAPMAAAGGFVVIAIVIGLLLDTARQQKRQ